MACTSSHSYCRSCYDGTNACNKHKFTGTIKLDVKKTKEEKRKQKHIDRIAWKAEAAQRFAKGGCWK